MNNQSKRHHPAHIFIDNEIYFLTARIFESKPILIESRKKELLNHISRLFLVNNYGLFAYAILEEHYHLLFKVSKAGLLPKILNKLHGSLSYKWNKDDNLHGRKIFQNYWDYCIRNQRDFWTHFNYIHQNPIKHGLVNNLQDLKEYKCCSYKQWISKKGEEWIGDCFTRYPVKDFIVEGE
ncbi:transposase [Patescibacteria group bacterium]